MALTTGASLISQSLGCGAVLNLLQLRSICNHLKLGAVFQAVTAWTVNKSKYKYITVLDGGTSTYAETVASRETTNCQPRMSE